MSPGDGSSVQPVESPYDPRQDRWNMDWPGRVSQHDLLYLSPPEDPALGLPVGNGDLGALMWTTDSALILAVNKCDTWDDGDPRAFRTWGAEKEEKHTSARHCGRLIVDFGCPVFDLLYQRSFEARLALDAAIASVHAETPFAGVLASAYISAEHRVLALRCALTGAEDYAPTVRLERWGSRTFTRWYSQVDRDPAHGLDGTRTRIEHDRIVIVQKLRDLSFALAAGVVPDTRSCTPRMLHGRAAAFELPAARHSAFTVYLAAATSENEPDPVSAVHGILDRAAADGEPAIREKHRQEWREFWSASLVDLPEKYLENIWHITLYLANSSSRGAYPPHFCNGLWSWNRDFVPWTYYFHWNMQWYYWPLHAANHAELASPYYRLRRAQLPHAREYAGEKLGKPGAFYADISDRRGHNQPDPDRNQTPGAQIALDFWRHYAFTVDQEFFKESAWPVILEVTRYYVACLQDRGDGHLHVPKTSAYEGSPLFDETITDLAMISALLQVAVLAGELAGHDPVEIHEWEVKRGRLAPFHLVALEAWEYEERAGTLVHQGGLTPGKKIASRRIFAVGRNEKGEWVRNRYGGRPDMAYYGVPDPEIVPVFPAGLIGLTHRGTELFQAAVTQLRLHPPTIPDPARANETSVSGAGELCMGWCPYTIALARLGMAEELAAELVNSVSTWQFYPQGFGHYGPYHVFRRDLEKRWHVNVARDAASLVQGDTPVEFPFPAWPFRHFDNEAMPIVSCAINEMLLQSHNGAIRVCPAVPADWHVRFDLAAAGGFRVKAEQSDGRIQWVALESRTGRVCRLVHPWPSEDTIVCLDVPADGEPRQVPVTEERVGLDRILRWDTQVGSRYLLVRGRGALDTWQVSRLSPVRREEPRRLKQAILGRERLF